MSERITAKKFTANVVISLTVQAVSLAVGFLLNLIVPKFIGEDQYAYWQMYLLYVGYVGVLHFGLLDGIVLRYSQYDYEELDKETVRSQFKILFVFTTILAVAAIFAAFAFTRAESRYIVAFVGLGIVSKNIHTYNSYSFQITNRINKYAAIVIAQKLSYGIAVTVLLACKVNDFRFYCLADLSGDAVAAAISLAFNRGMYFGRSLRGKESFAELKRNVSAGIILMLANFSALLIVGGAKMIVQWRWDKFVFGKVSFSFSLANVFTTFISAISVVLFPSLKRLEANTLPKLYKNIRSAVSLVLFGVMCAYFPGCAILNKWLPKYSESLIYLGYLLPFIIFSSKVSLLTNNYLKVYRKEKAMMAVNLCCVAGGFVLFFVAAFVFDNLILLLLSIVAVIMVNSMASEAVVGKVIGVRVTADFVAETVMVIIFIVSAASFSLWQGFVIYLLAFIAYCVFNYKTWGTFFRKIFKKKEKQK